MHDIKDESARVKTEFFKTRNATFVKYNNCGSLLVYNLHNVLIPSLPVMGTLWFVSRSVSLSFVGPFITW